MKIKKAVLSLAASLVVVTPGGEIYWQVLGDSTYEITKIADSQSVSDKTQVSLKNHQSSVVVTVTSETGSSEAEIKNFEDSLVEIQAKSAPQQVAIKKQGKSLVLQQQETVVLTGLDLTVDAESKKILVQTKTGQQYLGHLPKQVLQTSVLADYLTEGSISRFELSENENGQAVYLLAGEKKIKVLEFLEFSVPVELSISATNGKILDVKQPMWLPIVNAVL